MFVFLVVLVFLFFGLGHVQGRKIITQPKEHLQVINLLFSRILQTMFSPPWVDWETPNSEMGLQLQTCGLHL